MSGTGLQDEIFIQLYSSSGSLRLVLQHPFNISNFQLLKEKIKPFSLTSKKYFVFYLLLDMAFLA